MPGHPFDVCKCGDYQHQHVDGVGACKLGSLCFPAHCTQFQIDKRYVPQTEDEANELADNGRNTGGKVYR